MKKSTTSFGTAATAVQPLRLFFRWQREGNCIMLKMPVMGAIAKRLVLRQAATADRNDLSSAKIIKVPGAVANLKFSFHFAGAIVIYRNDRFSHCLFIAAKIVQ
jgi:hypothetical protein